HVGAIVGGEAVRHQVKPLQPEYVIEPDGAGMAHRGREHVMEWLERPYFEAGGVETRQPPVLAGGVQGIRWSADRQVAGNRRLLLPCVETVGLDPDRHVEVEADLHAEPGRKFAARPQLLIGTPLDEFDELDLSCVRAGVKGCGVSVVRLLPVRWPFPPWPVE